MRKKRWVCGMIAAGFLTACAENPESDIVVNKNEGKLEEAISKENEETGNLSEGKDSDGEENIPKQRCQKSFTTDNNHVVVQIDAELEPVDGPLPVVRVKPHTLTGEEVKAWTEVLFEGQTAYEPAALTKSEIEARILDLRERLNDPEGLVEQYGNQSDADTVAAILKEELEAYEEAYQDSSEEKVKVPCRWEFHPFGYYDELPEKSMESAAEEGLDETKQLIAVTEDLHGHKGYIHASNRDAEDYKLNMFSFFYEDELKDIPKKDMTSEETMAIGEELLEKLGLDDWEYDRLSVSENWDDKTKKTYSLWYTPSYQGVRSIAAQGIELKSEDLYAANYPYSSLRFDIESGFLKGMELISPMDVIKTENKDVAVLSFEDIYQSFMNYMKAYFNRNMVVVDPLRDDYNIAQVEVKITEIRQGLYRIKEQNNKEEFLMVPVWIFRGDSYADGNVEQTDWDFAVINALDGSVINTALGY